jgi:hypothetical protein
MGLILAGADVWLANTFSFNAQLNFALNIAHVIA